MEDETDFFHENKFSWNKEANIIYLEGPAGVGYSICPDPSECKFDDYNSGEDYFKALLKFFEKFPEFKTHDFYITGESYGGVYVP